MARPRGEDVKQDVVLATFDLVASKGVDGMSMRSLAENTGLSTGTINYHFGSKRNLLLTSITYGYKQRPFAWKESETIPNLRALLRRFELSNERRKTWWKFWLAVSAYAQADPEIAHFLAKQHSDVFDKFEAVLAEGKAQEIISESLDPKKYAANLVHKAHGIAIAQLIGGLDPKEAAAVFDDAVAELSQEDSIEIVS